MTKLKASAAKDFEADFREAMLAHDGGGQYSETIEFHCILAQPPTGS